MTTVTTDLIGTLHTSEQRLSRRAGDARRTPASRELASRRSLEVRRARTLHLDAIAQQTPSAGAKACAATLRTPPDWAASVRVGRLLRAVPKLGPRRAKPMLDAAGAQPTDRLRTLNVAQREIIARALLQFAERVTDTPWRGGPRRSSDTQRRAALQMANERRLARAAALDAVRAHHDGRDGLHAAAQLIATSDDPRLDNLPIYRIVAAVRRVGDTNARRIIVALGLRTTTTLGMLSATRRQTVADELLDLGRRPTRTTTAASWPVTVDGLERARARRAARRRLARELSGRTAQAA